MTAPRFSVLIATYNRKELLKITVDSVLNQTFSNYEVIVIDDGSSDGTVDLLRSYGSRITVLAEPNRGADVARSKGAAIAKGEYFVLLDHDDLLYPTSLETYDRVITALGAPPVILGSMSYFNSGEDPKPNPASDTTITYRQFRDFLSKDVGVGKSNSRIVLKRSLVEATGALQANPPCFPVDDANLLLVTGTASPCVLIHRPYTVAYRMHALNTAKRLDYMVNGLLWLAKSERQGRYPGGAARRLERYAFLGGGFAPFVGRTLRNREFGLAAKILAHTTPMIAATLINRARRYFRKPTPLSTLPA